MRIASEKELTDMGYVEVSPGRFARVNESEKKAIEEIRKKNNPFGHIKSGKYTIGGHIYNFRSKAEAFYACYLETLKRMGAITDWKYEPYKFIFHSITSGNNSYKPDFKVIEKDKYYWVEVKGHMNGASKTKLKRMKFYYPNETVKLVMKHELQEIKASGIVPRELQKEVLGEIWS